MALKTPISIIQEMMMAKKESLPDYSYESVGTLITPEFLCTLKVSSITVTAYARNKKEAKHKAAAQALEQLLNPNTTRTETNLGQEHKTNQNIPIDKRVENNMEVTKNKNRAPLQYIENINYIGKLQEYCVLKRGVEAVRYEVLFLLGSDQFKAVCIWNNHETFGYATTKKQAKQYAACEMLQLLTCNKSVPKIELEKEENDEVDSRAIEKFNELSTSTIVKKSNELPDDHSLPLDIDEDKEYTIEEAREQFEKLNLTPSVEMIQDDPCIVTVAVREKSLTVMATAENEEKAAKIAMNKALRSLIDDCPSCTFIM